MLMSDGERWLADIIERTLEREMATFDRSEEIVARPLAEAVAIELVLSRVRLP